MLDGETWLFLLLLFAGLWVRGGVQVLRGRRLGKRKEKNGAMESLFWLGEA